MNEIVKHEMAIDNGGHEIQLHRELTPAVWQMFERIGTTIYKSRAIKGINNPETAAFVILKGFELGFGISASLEFIQAIQGKYELIPRGALALLHGHPAIKSVVINRLEKGNVFLGYECTIERKDGFSYTAAFTMEDAARAGLVKPDSGWQKYPANMCLWRSVGFAADVAAPDITAGMTAILKMPEEYSVAIDDRGNVIDYMPTPQPTEQAPAPAPSNGAATLDLQSLIDNHGPDKVMQAMMEVTAGKMPATDEEIQQLAEKLG